MLKLYEQFQEIRILFEIKDVLIFKKDPIINVFITLIEEARVRLIISTANTSE
jgi:hypothetical protein